MDPGNFATNIQAGSIYGYDLLWVVLCANLVAMLFQGMSANLGIVTGQYDDGDDPQPGRIEPCSAPANGRANCSIFA
jgi:hypothetical protein